MSKIADIFEKVGEIHEKPKSGFVSTVICLGLLCWAMASCS